MLCVEAAENNQPAALTVNTRVAARIRLADDRNAEKIDRVHVELKTKETAIDGFFSLAPELAFT